MPNYDYFCENCNYKFEHFQTMSSELLVKCPNCKKKTLKRLIGSGGGIIFKGSDWPGRDIERRKEKNTGKENEKF